jgi:ABC-type Mn2+/Zn2+ transport system permease subunit
VLELITAPFEGGIGQRALAEVTLLGAVCGPLGVWVVLYRQSYAAESIAHGMLPGLVIAALAGIPLGLGAAAGIALAVGCIALASRARLVGGDAAVAVTVTTLFGAGSLLALAPGTPLRLGELLFGNPLSVSDGDLVASAALAAIALLALAGSHRTLVLSAFDPQSAAGAGGSNRRAALLLGALLGAATLVAVQALGNLLVVAIIVAPAAAALRLRARLLPSMLTAAALAVGSGVAGLYVSHYAELAAGASIALCATAVAGIVLVFPNRRPWRREKPGSGAPGSPVHVLHAGAD